MPDVSLVATLVATLLGFALGGIWYGPLFGKAWMAAAGLTEEEIRRDFNPARTYGWTFVLGFITSYVFGLYLGPNPGLAFSVVAGAAVGVFFVATTLAVHTLFERRRFASLGINAGYDALRFTLIGLAFGLLG